ncbi:MAG: hypothetical protein J0H06_02220, partial [Actinobacteria bacterium]|nr:hypothetical protein [Actinomycetota bacterium]
MRARWGGAVVGLLVAVGLLAPAAAPGAETFSFGPGSVTYARVHATHGYRVNFAENDKGYFFVRVVGHGTTTDYTLRTGRPPGNRLVGDYGRRGRFDLRFVPVGKPEALPTGSQCEGGAGSWQAGYLVGEARFRTERGFARIDLHRLPAADESWPRLTCEFGHLAPPGHPKEQRTTVTATASSEPISLFSLKPPRRLLSFRVTRYYRHAKPADERVTFAAELKERGGRISIRRKTVVKTGESSLRFPGLPQLPEELVVKPPLPF